MILPVESAREARSGLCSRPGTIRHAMKLSPGVVLPGDPRDTLP